MDWARAIERNSEALKGIVEALFAMLGLAGRRHGGADSAAPPPRRAAPAPARRIRHAAPCRHRGARPCGEACSFAAHAGGANHREGRELTSLLPALRSAEKFRSSLRRRTFTRNPPRIHIFGNDPRVAALWSAPQPLADPAPPPDGLVNAARLSPQAPSPQARARRICRARPGVSPAGGSGGRTHKAPKFRSPLRPGHPPGYRRKAGSRSR